MSLNVDIEVHSLNNESKKLCLHRVFVCTYLLMLGDVKFMIFFQSGLSVENLKRLTIWHVIINLKPPKGKIISKGLFCILGFFQKTNEQIRIIIVRQRKKK